MGTKELMIKHGFTRQDKRVLYALLTESTWVLEAEAKKAWAEDDKNELDDLRKWIRKFIRMELTPTMVDIITHYKNRVKELQSVKSR